MNKKFTFHIIGNAHLPVCKKYLSCAFNIKHYRMCEMLMSMGHTVYCYGAKSTVSDTPPCTEFISTHTVQDISKDYGDGDNRSELSYAWQNADWRHDYNTEKKPSTLKFYSNCIEEINKRKKQDDFLLCMQGAYHSPISDAVDLFLTCEPGIGYRGSVEKRFRAFESSYIQNFTEGSYHPFECINGNFYNRVIPNYFDDNDIEFSEEKDDYYLFIGRMIKRKGILIAAKTCNAIGKKLIIAGQGAHVDQRGYLIPNEDPDFELAPGTWEYVGYADVEKRKKLMAKAIAVFTATEYLDCFCGVHSEAMLSGTPPITTSFGVFPGTIPDCVDGMFHLTDLEDAVGFKCNTLQDFVDAALKAQYANPISIRKYGERFLMDNVKHEYQKWWCDLMAVYESTIDSNRLGWHRLKENISKRSSDILLES